MIDIFKDVLFRIFINVECVIDLPIFGVSFDFPLSFFLIVGGPETESV
jgi:hypothetical protein